MQVSTCQGDGPSNGACVLVFLHLFLHLSCNASVDMSGRWSIQWCTLDSNLDHRGGHQLSMTRSHLHLYLYLFVYLYLYFSFSLYLFFLTATPPQCGTSIVIDSVTLAFVLLFVLVFLHVFCICIFFGLMATPLHVHMHVLFGKSKNNFSSIYISKQIKIVAEMFERG